MSATARLKDDYPAHVAKLSRLSVTKHHDAYGDIAWDAPENAIDLDDPRWELLPGDPLGATDWYRAQPPAVRRRIGLHTLANFMKIGHQFEGVLKRGLLEMITVLPDDAVELRYLYHEVIEEAQHALMFREFVRRAQTAAALEVPGIPRVLWHLFQRRIVRLATQFPELFFIFVLGGEEPIDFVQRETLASERGIPPLPRRIIQIHVTEEARHVSFARRYLVEHCADLTPRRRAAIAVAAPIILGLMSRVMLRPGSHMAREYGIPKPVLATMARANRRRAQASLRKLHELCGELGLVGKRSAKLWETLGIAGGPSPT